MRYIAAALLCLSLLLLPTAAGASSAVGAANVQVSDLPPGALLLKEMDQTPVQLAVDDHTTLAAELRQGIVHQDIRIFTLNITRRTAPGLLATVEQFTSPAKAHLAYEKTRQPIARGLQAHAQLPPHTQLLQIGSLGDERFGISLVDTSGVPQTLAVFRHGNYVVYLLILHTNAAYPGTQAIRLAHLVDGRLTHLP